MRISPIRHACALLLPMAAIVLAAQPSRFNPIVIQTTSFPDARVGELYHAPIQLSGGTPPYTFHAIGLPPGLSIGLNQGVIAGTPPESAAGLARVVLTVTDSAQPHPLSATVVLNLGVDLPASQEACGQLSLGPGASFNGFIPFQPTDAWITDISSAPLDPDNTSITSASGFAGLHLHHDWSSVDGGDYGIPYVIVDSSSTPMVPINVIDYPDESDVALAPFPIDAPIEGAPADCSGWPDDYVGDSHVLVVDRRTCKLYETFNTHRCNGAWNASSETIWDLKHYENRPWGWTSADAAGLPIMPGLVRYDEIEAGEIRHAIRFTMQVTKNDANDGYFVPPATHAAGVYYGVSNIMGMRIRLNKDFDISKYSRTNQIILTAMKKYGMILADNGGYFFFQGVADPRWNDDDLSNLDSIQSSNFDVVKMDPPWPGWDSVSAPSGSAPTIVSFTASKQSIMPGTPVLLQWVTANESYNFIDNVGAVSGQTVTVRPTQTTTYTLNSTNHYGRAQQSVTVRVQ